MDLLPDPHPLQRREAYRVIDYRLEGKERWPALATSMATSSTIGTSRPPDHDHRCLTFTEFTSTSIRFWSSADQARNPLRMDPGEALSDVAQGTWSRRIASIEGYLRYGRLQKCDDRGSDGRELWNFPYNRVFWFRNGEPPSTRPAGDLMVNADLQSAHPYSAHMMEAEEQPRSAVGPAISGGSLLRSDPPYACERQLTRRASYATTWTRFYLPPSEARSFR